MSTHALVTTSLVAVNVDPGSRSAAVRATCASTASRSAPLKTEPREEVVGRAMVCMLWGGAGVCVGGGVDVTQGSVTQNLHIVSYTSTLFHTPPHHSIHLHITPYTLHSIPNTSMPIRGCIQQRKLQIRLTRIRQLFFMGQQCYYCGVTGNCRKLHISAESLVKGTQVSVDCEACAYTETSYCF